MSIIRPTNAISSASADVHTSNHIQGTIELGLNRYRERVKMPFVPTIQFPEAASRRRREVHSFLFAPANPSLNPVFYSLCGREVHSFLFVSVALRTLASHTGSRAIRTSFEPPSGKDTVAYS